MKKLLIATDTYLPRIDGISIFLSKITPRLKSNFDITILSPNFGNNNDSTKQIRINLLKVLIGDFTIAKFDFKKIRKAIKETDVVFVQTISTIGILSIIYAKKYKKPIITYKHSIEWELVPNAINKPILSSILTYIVKTGSRIIYNKCDIILAPSQLIAEKLSWYKFKSKKAVVTVGIDSSIFIPNNNKNITKESIGINPNNLIIGYHGRLAHEKGLSTLVRAFRRLKRKYPNIKLLILGSGVTKLKEYLNKKDIISVPNRKNVVPYLQAMDIYCMPSTTETSCLSLIEAMSCGLAVVSTKTGSITDYLENNKNGLLVDKKDTNHLYKALETLIEYPEMRKRFGLSARRTVKELFNWDKTAQQIINITTNLLNEKK